MDHSEMMKFLWSLFFKVQIWVFWVSVCSFRLIFYPLDPWIRIFLRTRIQEAKILRIRILSTVYEIDKSSKVVTNEVVVYRVILYYMYRPCTLLSKVNLYVTVRGGGDLWKLYCHIRSIGPLFKIVECQG